VDNLFRGSFAIFFMLLAASLLGGAFPSLLPEFDGGGILDSHII
jgi:hypothetical protein